MAKPPWTPWHAVVQLRDDLKSGALPLHLFAADLYEVLMQKGRRPVYERPEEFFALTFPTYNLRRLVSDVVRRVAGLNDKAVRQLELTYGGGKTHTLITLRHLVTDPDGLPDLPTVAEFVAEIGQAPPKARVAGLCFDKLDPDKGMDVSAPDGKIRTLKYPWSVLAYQIAGDAGLKILHAENRAEERTGTPFENLLAELLDIPARDGLGTLILMDEVLAYAREMAAIDAKWNDRLVHFFQFLTQAATKVDRCCIVASLLASDPAKTDVFGRRLQGDLYDIFQRAREEVVEPVVKEDVAEVLRRRFFKPDSIKDRNAFRPHVQAALKGICALDEQTARQGADAEERFLKSYPFHPDLTEVLYTKWTSLPHFQKARGALRTFALALREAVQWDRAPLVGPAVLLNAPDRHGLSEATRELVNVADLSVGEGGSQAWTGILVGELDRARDIQQESVGLRFREIEQAVLTTFLHSLPVGQSAHTRDLTVLAAATRPDRIEMEKGLRRWVQTSHWLDDRHTSTEDGKMPDTWRLGNRPNLVQMHAVASKRVTDEVVRARLLDDIGKTKSLSAGAAALDVRVHTLPPRPRDVEDDRRFHYVVLGPKAVSDSGNPSAEARRYLDETSGPDKPRVYRNAVLLLTPSREGLEVASARVRDYLAWEQVKTELNAQQREGSVDLQRVQTLNIHLDTARGRIPEAIRQAYCIVVSVSEKNKDQAFKINVTDEPHFAIIKRDERSRIQESLISAEALLPDGPYDLWREGETSRRVRDLYGAFAQMPHLPKMLKAGAILDTLKDGCAQGTFVLRLARPDGSARTWWFDRPDDTAMNDAAMELVLPEAAELTELLPELLAKGALPKLWPAEAITVQQVMDYFSGTTVVELEREGYQEPLAIPRASGETVMDAVRQAVERGTLWMTSGPASVWAEPIPSGVLALKSQLHTPPVALTAVEMLPENLPEAWTAGEATALSIATALSNKCGQILPWKTVKDVIDASLRARFTELLPSSAEWPCDYPGAQMVRLKLAEAPPKPGIGEPSPNVLRARTSLEAAQIQDLAELIPQLTEISARANTEMRFQVVIELGDGKTPPAEKTVEAIDRLLMELAPELRLL